MIKLIKHHWHWRRQRFYRKTRWHLVLDLSLGIIIIMLVAAVLTMHYYQPNLSSLLSFNAHKDAHIDLDNPPLELQSSIIDPSFKPGDKIAVALQLENSSDKDIKNIRLSFVPDNSFDITKIENTKEDENIEINEDAVSIKVLAANKKVNLDLVVYPHLNARQKILDWDLQLEYVINGQIVKDSFSLDSLKVVSSMFVTSVAYYNSPQGDLLGAGPIPPIAYLPTNYWIFWKVQPDGDFKNFVMSAQLPRGIELTDNQALLAGSFNYNADSRRIVWQLSDVKAVNTDYRVSFEVQLTPEEEQVGKVVPLIVGTKYYANDVLSNREVGGSLNNLNTNLDSDKINRGQGTVVNQ